MSHKKLFKNFYNTNIDKIYRFVFFRTGQNKELAEDLVSEIFFKALKNFANYDEMISQTAWIFTIAKNHLANYWRDNAKKNNVSLSETTVRDDENGEIVIEEKWFELSYKKYADTETKREIYDLLAKLDPADQDLVTLHYLFGYSYREIARMKVKTETAIKVAVHRVIKKMRSNL